MKKKLLLALPVVASVAGASWAGSTYYSSSESRSAYERILSDLTESTVLSFVTTSYTEGFMESEAITEIRASSEPDASVIARLRHNIEHSPEGTSTKSGISAARVLTTFITEDIEDEAFQELLGGFGSEAPVIMRSSIGFNGIVSNELVVAAYNSDISDDMTLSSDGAVWNFDVDENGSMAGSGSWSGLKLTGPEVNITVSPSVDSFNYTRHAPAVYSGGYEFKLSEVIINSPMSGINFGARDLGISSSADVEGGLLSSDYTFWVNDIDAPIALDSAKITGRAGGIDISTLEDARNIAMKAQLSDVDGLSEDEFNDLALELVSAYGEMIQPGAYLGYEVSLGNAGGKADADITLTFEGDGSPSGYDLLTSPSATMADLLRAVRVDANMDASNDALALTPAGMFLDPAMLSPWVVDNVDTLSSKIVLDELIIDANGESIALEMMLGDALYEPLELDKLLSL